MQRNFDKNKRQTSDHRQRRADDDKRNVQGKKPQKTDDNCQNKTLAVSEENRKEEEVKVTPSMVENIGKEKNYNQKQVAADQKSGIHNDDDVSVEGEEGELSNDIAEKVQNNNTLYIA